jgi:intein/homing endonuclease
MTERDLRLDLLNTLLTTPHRNLTALYPLHQEILTQDPRFYVRLAAWYAGHGEVRDHQEMFVICLCLSQAEGHRDVGLALLRRLPPYQLARVVDFIKGHQVKRRVPVANATTDSGSTTEAAATPATGSTGRRGRKVSRTRKPSVPMETRIEQVGLFVNIPRSMRTEIERYLRERERQSEKFDQAVLHARAAIKRLYAGLHIRPTGRAQAVLFSEEPPEGSVFAAMRAIRQAETPAEQARALVEHHIPYRVATSLVKQMSPTVLAALVEVMTPQEVINNIGSLKARGAFDNEDVKKLVEAKLEAAKSDKRVSAYKAKVAVEAANVSGELAEQLDAITEAQVKAKGRITRSTAMLIDKCVIGSTLICTEHGLLPISALTPQVRLGVKEVVLDLEVATRSGKSRATRLYLNGKKPVRYIETAKGFRLGTSLNHPILCYDPATASLVWRTAETLTVGDYVALRRNTRSFGSDPSLTNYLARTPHQPTEVPLRVPAYMTPELARWLGYVVAEGRIHVRPAFVDFTNSDEQLVADFTELTTRLFGVATRVERRNGAKHVMATSEELLHFLRDGLGFKKVRAQNCEVPLCVLMASEETQRAFLRAYFAGDGGPMNRRAGVLAATSASEKLLRTIQVMLLNFGIVSRLKPTSSYATNGSRIAREYWRLSIGGNDALRFMREIGFASDAKHAAVEVAVVNGHTLTWSDRRESVPSLAQVARLTKRGMLYQLHQAFPTVAAFGGKAKDDRIPADLLSPVIHALPEFGDIGDIREVVESQLFLDAIANITAGEEEVYDICVPEDHSFVSNGVVSHNSGSMHVAIEVGRQLGAMISSICAADLVAYAFDTIAYAIEVKGTSLAEWEKALTGITAGGGTSCGVAIETMRRKGQRVEQIILVTDEGENQAPLFANAYKAYSEETNTRPDVILVKVGHASNILERACTGLGIAPSVFTFSGDYYALPNLIPLLQRPSMVDMLMEILEYPLPERKAS